MSRPWSLVDSPVTSRTSPSSSSFTLRWPRPRNHASTAATTAGRTVAGSTRDTSRVPRGHAAPALAPLGAGPPRARSTDSTSSSSSSRRSWPTSSSSSRAGGEGPARPSTASRAMGSATGVPLPSSTTSSVVPHSQEPPGRRLIRGVRAASAVSGGALGRSVPVAPGRSSSWTADRLGANHEGGCPVDNVLRHHRPRRRATAFMAVLVVALLAASTSPARAQDDPTPIAKALTLASPGVVSVIVGADVSIQLHRTFRDVVGLRKFSYSTHPMSGGSGMAVAPNWIVTASHVVDLDEDQKDDARIYAANRLFFDRLELKDAFGDLSDTEYYEEQHLWDPLLEEVLQGCYNEVYCKFEIKPNVTVVAPVQVGGAKPKELAAKIGANTSFEEGDTAALELIDADPLATVPLATTAGELQRGERIVATGYPGSATQILKNGRTEPSSSFGNVSNVTTDGNSEVIQVDMRAESG